MHVHRELRRAILHGQFPAGSRLIETALAEMLNVSRTPVREAISKLELEGLVRRLKTGGIVVEDNSTKIAEVVVIRQCLEGAAARLACLRASDEELAGLAKDSHNAEEVVRTSSLQKRSAMDWEFHQRLAAAAHSPRLARLIEEFYEYSFSELMPPADGATLDVLQRQHVAITDALGRRDGEEAERLIREHLDTALKVSMADAGNGKKQKAS
ncbi:GntR family transcriptional regulator [Paraburkholderia tropica]|uniref:GntR family transcriptional regulator n=1 Tax=Paraburkholderia tropica TaxID=92647 RepID=UPI002AB7D79D|nr:GntR family transcriptional regulator [Paraburkholderia tropica]